MASVIDASMAGSTGAPSNLNIAANPLTPNIPAIAILRGGWHNGAGDASLEP